MNLKSLIAAACAAATVFAAGAAFAQEQAPPALPQTPEAWRAAAEGDLEALRMLIREDTPVAIDDENPRMQRWFEAGYRQARARARRAIDQASYFYALAAYANGFQDPHLRVFAQPALQISRWPGFIVTASGDEAVVHYRDDADPNAPPMGARVLRCDGRTLTALRQRIVYPFTLNPQLAADRRSSAPRLFLDRGNTYAPPPRRCVFEENGERRTRTLSWRDIPQGDVYWTQYNQASLGPGATFGLATPAEGVTWIGAPTFDNNSGAELQALVDQINANAEAIRNGRAVIIDVRGNGGGNSAWGIAIARAVWGDAPVEAIPDSSPGGATDWRVSQRNLDYINSFAPQLLEQFGEYSETGLWIRAVQNGLSGALERGDPVWRQREEGDERPIPASGGYTQRRPQGPSPIPAQVYILSNGTCASACLDFSDVVLHIPGTRLIGADTSGDGLLMEVRDETLPSGFARAVLPLKIYRGRARGALEAYTADVAYDGVWTDEAVRAWVMALVQAPAP